MALAKFCCQAMCNFCSRRKIPKEKEYIERIFTYVLLQSTTRSVATHLESYLFLHKHYTSQLDNLFDNIEVDQLEVGWITWHRDYAYNKMWGDSRTSILKAMKYKL